MVDFDSKRKARTKIASNDSAKTIDVQSEEVQDSYDIVPTTKVNGIAPAAPSVGFTLVSSLQDALEIGHILAQSRFFKGVQSESQAVAKILRGHELGISPVAALENINVIEGRTSINAALMSALIRRSNRYRMKVHKGHPTTTGCSIDFYEIIGNKEEFLGTVTFDEQDAKSAGLTKKQNWQRHPKDMYFARTVSAGARRYCSDLFMGGVYTPEELEDGRSRPSDLGDEQDLELSMTEEEEPEDNEDSVICQLMIEKIIGYVETLYLHDYELPPELSVEKIDDMSKDELVRLGKAISQLQMMVGKEQISVKDQYKIDQENKDG